MAGGPGGGAVIFGLIAPGDGASAFGGVGYAPGVRSPLLHPSVWCVVVVAAALSACDARLLGPIDSDRTADANGPAEVIAVAGADLVVLEGNRVMLDGGASRGLLGDVTLSWSQREGPAVVLSNPSSPSPVFTAPLSPTRLVFALEASSEALRDIDIVIVDVVDHASLLPAAPATLASPGDRTAIADDNVVIELPWQGVGAPRVDVRCARRSVDEPFIEAGVLHIGFAPALLPCPVVVDDDADGRSGGRSVIVVWPANTAIPATRAAVQAPDGDTDGPLFLAPGETVDVDVDADTRLTVVDGNPLVLEATSPTTYTFTAPRRAGRLTFAAEARSGAVSGGVRIVSVDVRPGVGNSAPTISAGPDLHVAPGAHFRIVPSTDDDDDDEVTVAVIQVLGEIAQQVGGGVGVLAAPATAQTLLFHVVGNDGVVDSATDPVRVVVDLNAENLPPVLDVAGELYVVPGGTFVIDASSARDPDSGLIVSTRIAQQPNDDVQLLADAVDAASVTLTAGAAGDVYRFVLSAIDGGGLEASATVAVFVQEAGPWVDAVRGVVDGDGTVARPFPTIAAAVQTATRHRFPQLHLGAGPHALTALPDGLGLVGGHRFDDNVGDYVAVDAPADVVVTGTVDIAGADVDDIALRGDGRLRVRRRTTLDRVAVGVPLDVLAGAHVIAVDGSLVATTVVAASLSLIDVDVVGGIVADQAAVAIARGRLTASAGALAALAALDVDDGTVTVEGTVIAGPVTGVRLGGAVIASIGGAVDVGRIEGGGVRAERVSGIVVEGGAVDLAGVAIRVGGANVGTGIVVVRDSVVGGHVDIRVENVGRGLGLDAVGAVLSGSVAGSIVVEAADVARGLVVGDGRLAQLRVGAFAPDAIGVVAPRLDARAVLVTTSGPGSVGVFVGAGTLRHVTAVAETGVVVDGAGVVALRNVALRATVGIVGVVDRGVVGLASDAPAGCDGCLIASSAAVLVDGSLGTTDFVDVGDVAEAVAVDVDGRAVPQGAGPDLGAIERQ